MKNTLLNVLVEPNQYKAVINFKAGSIALASARSNTIKAIQNTSGITNNQCLKKVGIKTKSSPMN